MELTAEEKAFICAMLATATIQNIESMRMAIAIYDKLKAEPSG